VNKDNLIDIPIQAVEWYMLPFMASPWPVKLVVGFCVMVAAVSLCWWLIIKQNKSAGRSTSEYWNVIKNDPMAVAYSRRTVFFSIFGLVAAIAWKALS